MLIYSYTTQDRGNCGNMTTGGWSVFTQFPRVLIELYINTEKMFYIFFIISHKEI